MTWAERIEYDLVPRCYEPQFHGADILPVDVIHSPYTYGGNGRVFCGMLPVDVIHSPYTYGGNGRVFCGMCSRRLNDEQINALARFTNSCACACGADKIARSWK